MESDRPGRPQSMAAAAFFCPAGPATPRAGGAAPGAVVPWLSRETCSSLHVRLWALASGQSRCLCILWRPSLINVSTLRGTEGHLEVTEGTACWKQARGATVTVFFRWQPLSHANDVDLIV